MTPNETTKCKPGGPRHSLDRLVLRWPVKIRREIGEWFGGAICGHGSVMSKPAARRWRYFLKKLEAQNAKLRDAGESGVEQH